MQSSSLLRPLAGLRRHQRARLSTQGGGQQPGLNFNDVEQAFKSKSNMDIVRALLVFRLCSFRWLVKNSKKLLDMSYKVLGVGITHWGLKQTFFGHFCAGESADEIQPKIDRLEASGIGAILDYAAEADVQEPTGGQLAQGSGYEGEAECDANAKICLSCIEAAGRRPDGFAAIKLTALGKPEFLEHLSLVLLATYRLYHEFCVSRQQQSPRTIPPGARISSLRETGEPYHFLEKRITFADFKAGLKLVQLEVSEEEARRLFDSMDVDKSAEVDYLEWINFLDPRTLAGPNPMHHAKGLPYLSEEELVKFENMLRRLDSLAKAAAEKKVRLMVDAEQTYFQPAIDHITLQLQRKYNKNFPTIYNTYQCYLKDSGERIQIDMERAQREGFKFAAKLVRGAYMVQERRRSQELGYPDPIRNNLSSTHDNYHQCLELVLRNIHRCEIMIASHNENTVRFATSKMTELGIASRGGGVYFGQLLGMCDHVSFGLGHLGYSVFKYVPYGPVKYVIPYLLRRAEENSDIMGGVSKERKLLWNELMRRRVPILYRAPKN